MKAKWLILAFVVLGLVVAPSVCLANGGPTIQTTQGTAYSTFISTNGELGLFLIGTWDNEITVTPSESVQTSVQLVNPHPGNRWAFVTFWSANELPLACSVGQLTPNGSAKVGVNGGIYHSGTDTTYYYGAVKVLVTNDNGNPDIGLVGYRKSAHICDNCNGFSFFTQSEIRLQPVPPKVAFADKNPQDGTPDEVKAIRDLCQPD